MVLNYIDIQIDMREYIWKKLLNLQKEPRLLQV